MTCIVGLQHDGDVYIGGDSAASGGWEQHLLSETKVFENGPFLFGWAGSSRDANLIRHAFTPPLRDSSLSDMKFLVTVFMDAVRNCLKAGGSSWVKDNKEYTHSHFLVAYRGGLYAVYGDYQIMGVTQNYLAVGSGSEVAHGAMYASGHDEDLTPEGRLRTALAAAAFHTPFVRDPFHILKAPKE